jgi:oxygen-independent coproporphyrinogen-3 oxidase
MEWKRSYIDALKREMHLRRAEIDNSRVPTLYIGGGTPSHLPTSLLQEMFQAIHENFTLMEDAEVTIEANPDDVSPEWLAALRNTPVNRISMGVQTFSDSLLRFLNRRHSSSQAIEAVKLCQDAGYSNISLDLIYGLPGQTFQDWKNDVQQLLALGVPHLSAYALSFEEGTVLGRMLQDGSVDEASDELSWQMYEYLMDETKDAGMEHYEISNFAKPGMHSRHNSSYWNGSPYLGLGPGAHSYDGDSIRRSNNTSLKDYIQATADVPHQDEVLTPQEQYNELVMTRLRTSQGLDLGLLTPNQKNYCLQMAEPHILSGNLIQEDLALRLSRKGIFISNSIISDLMY